MQIYRLISPVWISKNMFRFFFLRGSSRNLNLLIPKGRLLPPSRLKGCALLPFPAVQSDPPLNTHPVLSQSSPILHIFLYPGKEIAPIISFSQDNRGFDLFRNPSLCWLQIRQFFHYLQRQFCILCNLC